MGVKGLEHLRDDPEEPTNGFYRKPLEESTPILSAGSGRIISYWKDPLTDK